MAHVICRFGDPKYLDGFLDTRNSKILADAQRTPLHWACLSNDLKKVQTAVKLGGLNEMKDKYGRYPWDYTDNQEIKDYLQDLRKNQPTLK